MASNADDFLLFVGKVAGLLHPLATALTQTLAKSSSSSSLDEFVRNTAARQGYQIKAGEEDSCKVLFRVISSSLPDADGRHSFLPLLLKLLTLGDGERFDYPTWTDLDLCVTAASRFLELSSRPGAADELKACWSAFVKTEAKGGPWHHKLPRVEEVEDATRVAVANATTILATPLSTVSFDPRWFDLSVNTVWVLTGVRPKTVFVDPGSSVAVVTFAQVQDADAVLRKNSPDGFLLAGAKVSFSRPSISNSYIIRGVPQVNKKSPSDALDEMRAYLVNTLKLSLIDIAITESDPTTFAFEVSLVGEREMPPKLTVFGGTALVEKRVNGGHFVVHVYKLPLELRSEEALDAACVKFLETTPLRIVFNKAADSASIVFPHSAVKNGQSIDFLPAKLRESVPNLVAVPFCAHRVRFSRIAHPTMDKVRDLLAKSGVPLADLEAVKALLDFGFLVPEPIVDPMPKSVSSPSEVVNIPVSAIDWNLCRLPSFRRLLWERIGGSLVELSFIRKAAKNFIRVKGSKLNVGSAVSAINNLIADHTLEPCQITVRSHPLLSRVLRSICTVNEVAFCTSKMHFNPQSSASKNIPLYLSQSLSPTVIVNRGAPVIGDDKLAETVFVQVVGFNEASMESAVDEIARLQEIVEYFEAASDKELALVKGLAIGNERYLVNVIEDDRQYQVVALRPLDLNDGLLDVFEATTAITVPNIPLAIDEVRMRFLHQTRSLELAALVDRWKHDYSRSVVEIDPVYSRHGTVTVTGSRESAVRLKRQLLSLTTDILAVVPSLHIFEKYSKKRTNKVDDMVRAHIADLSFSVRSRFDAIVDIDPDNVMKITVAGSSAVEVEDVVQMLERVMVVESAIVVSAAVVKAMSNACVNFTSTYNVLIEQDQSKSEPTLIITAPTQAVCDLAINEIRSERFSTFAFHIESLELSNIHPRGRLFKTLLNDLLKPFFAKHPKVAADLVRGETLKLRGPRADVDALKAALIAAPPGIDKVLHRNARVPEGAAKFLRSRLMKELKGAVQVDFDPVMSKNECVVKFASGSEIHIKEANILHLRVDAIVSPGNSALSNASGLANIISLNAGEQTLDPTINMLQKECNAVTNSSRKKLPSGSAIRTTSGNLLDRGIKFVCHVVSPKNRKPKLPNLSNEALLLERCVTGSLDLLRDYQESAGRTDSSIAIPAIGTGKQAWQHDEACPIMVKAVANWLSKHPQRAFKIFLVADKPEGVTAFANACRQLYKPQTAPAPLEEALKTKLRQDLANAPLCANWYFGKDTRFPQAHSDAMERAFLNNEASWPPADAKVGFTIDFNAMVRIDEATKERVNIFRLLRQGVRVDVLPQMRDIYNVLHPQTVTYGLIGQTPTLVPASRHLVDLCDGVPCEWMTLSALDSGELDKAKALLEADVKLLRVEEEVQCLPLFAVSDDLLHRINAIFRDRGIVIKAGPMRKGLIMEGYKRALQLGQEEVSYLVHFDLLRHQRAIMRQAVAVPPTWLIHEPLDDVSFVSIDLHCEDVGKLQLQQWPQFTVTKVERVENRGLWDDYASTIGLIAARRGGKIPETRLLFLGSRMSPSSWAKSDLGLDWRASAPQERSTWGLAAPLSVDLVSANDRAFFLTEDGQRQVLVVRAIIGDAAENISPNMERDQAPPGYDSIRVKTANGTDAFVVFNSEALYPAYVLTYDMH